MRLYVWNFEYMFSSNLYDLPMYNEFFHFVYVLKYTQNSVGVARSSDSTLKRRSAVTQTNSAARLLVSQKVNTAAFKTKS